MFYDRSYLISVLISLFIALSAPYMSQQATAQYRMHQVSYHGTTLSGISLSKTSLFQAPSLQRPSLQRPSLQRPSLQRPSIQATSVQITSFQASTALSIPEKFFPPGVTSYGWQWRGAAAAGSSSSGSTADLPFWLHSDRYGELDRYSANTTLNLFGSWHRTLDSGISFSAGTDVLFRGAGQSVIRLQEAYVQAGYGHYVLSAGRIREEFGLLHPELSMGTTDLSHNARPMPKIIFATDGFKPIPGTYRVFYYDASLAHGWMEDSDYRYPDNVLLHQKHLYLRMFTEDSPIYPRAGLIHFAQWGGNTPEFGASPVNLRTWRDVFFSLKSDSREIIGGGELANHFQNHLGTYDFALMLNLGRYKISVSRLFMLEDTPNARFGTPWDGMWGAWIELRPDPRTRWRRERPAEWRTEHRPLVKSVNYEHINTLDGLTRYVHRDPVHHVNYYNHWVYRGGWTYYGRVLGNPLFTGDLNHLGVVNNQLVGHHVGMMGHAGPVDWRFFTTYSRNYGAGHIYLNDGRREVGLTDRKDQWSFMLEMKTGTLHPSIEAATTLALDTGDLYPGNFGVMLSLRWRTHTTIRQSESR